MSYFSAKMGLLMGPGQDLGGKLWWKSQEGKDSAFLSTVKNNYEQQHP